MIAARIEHQRLVDEIRARDEELRKINEMAAEVSALPVAYSPLPPQPIDEKPALVKPVVLPVDEKPALVPALPVPVDEKPALVKSYFVPVDEKPALVPALPVPVDEKPALVPALPQPVDERAAFIKPYFVPVDEKPALVKPVPVDESPALIKPAVVAAAPVAHAAPVAPVAPAAEVPVVTASQYHAQDELGQYNYGYSNPLSAKQESKTADGVVTGGYRYVDANGKVQTVNYISDALGFRVSATNLPVHVVSEPAVQPVVEAVVEEEAAPEAVAVEIKPAVQPVVTPQVAYSYLPYATNYDYLLPGQTINVQSPVQVQPQVVKVAAAEEKPLMKPLVSYSFLPYATNHPYYFY